MNAYQHVSSRPSPWLMPLRRSPAPKLRLICFPYAGGSASIYRPWLPKLAADIDVLAIQMPGRESRFSDPLCDDPQVLLPTLKHALAPWLDRPTVLFGYSMGGLLAYALAREFQAGPEAANVCHLVIAACASPDTCLSFDPDNLSRDEFLAYVQTLGGTPQQVFEHPELLDLMLPMLQSDFRLVHRLRQSTGLVLPDQLPTCPVTLVSARDDEHAKPEQVASWDRFVMTPPTHVSIDGGHFTPWSNTQWLIDAALTGIA